MFDQPNTSDPYYRDADGSKKGYSPEITQKVLDDVQKSLDKNTPGLYAMGAIVWFMMFMFVMDSIVGFYNLFFGK